MSINIGILDIQGSVTEHFQMLKKIGIKPVLVKTKKDLGKVDGLIIPGGESTTIGKLLKLYGLDEEIRKRALHPSPFTLHSLSIYGTCAGAILLANISLMDMEIERNAYGRQLDSFETNIKVKDFGSGNFPAVFIRAPRIKRASPNVKILAKYNGMPVMLRQENLLATTFHPELTRDSRIHKYFIKMTQYYAGTKSKNRASKN